MKPSTTEDASQRLPSIARWLGFAGLLPQLLLVAALISEVSNSSFTAANLALVYSALILSFLGGTWWGLAARSAARVPLWIWLAAIATSLIGFAALAATVIGQEPRMSLYFVGGALIGALGVDFRLATTGMCPRGWLGLRVPLSLGLGGLTILTDHGHVTEAIVGHLP